MQLVEIEETMSELEVMNIFAKNLDDLMKEFGYTQIDLAWDAHLDKSTICRYLKGEIMPSFKALNNLCICLDCNIEDLMPCYYAKID